MGCSNQEPIRTTFESTANSSSQKGTIPNCQFVMATFK